MWTADSIALIQQLVSLLTSVLSLIWVDALLKNFSLVICSLMVVRLPGLGLCEWQAA